METWIDNLQKKDKVEYESAYSKTHFDYYNYFKKTIISMLIGISTIIILFLLLILMYILDVGWAKNLLCNSYYFFT